MNEIAGELAQQIGALANAYRTTMSAGDNALEQQRVERKILHALVAHSAAETATWTQSRVQDGADVAKPLVDLAAVLDKGNIVGRSLTSAQDHLLKQAKYLSA